MDDQLRLRVLVVAKELAAEKKIGWPLSGRLPTSKI